MPSAYLNPTSSSPELYLLIVSSNSPCAYSCHLPSHVCVCSCAMQQHESKGKLEIAAQPDRELAQPPQTHQQGDGRRAAAGRSLQPPHAGGRRVARSRRALPPQAHQQDDGWCGVVQNSSAVEATRRWEVSRYGDSPSRRRLACNGRRASPRSKPESSASLSATARTCSIGPLLNGAKRSRTSEPLVPRTRVRCCG